MSFFQNHCGWPLVPLKNIATLKRGYDLPVGARNEGAVPIYAANGKNGAHDEVKIKGPGVITGRSGTIGKVHYCEEDFWPLNTALYVMDFHGNHPRWVYYMLSNFKLERFSEGAGVPTLNRNLVHDELIPLPPLSEQKRIAAILDKADVICRKRQQAIQLADDFLRVIFLDMFGDPVANPKGWEIRPLIELIDPSRPITYGILKPGDDIEGGVPYVRVVDMKDGVVLVGQVRRAAMEIAQQYKRSSLKAGDVLMSIRGHVGRLAVVPKELEGANITQDTARLATNSSCSSLYLYACLENHRMQQEMQRFVKGAAVKGINLADVKELRIPVPPIEFQKKIERKVELMTAILTSLERSSICLLDGFKSLSQKAFSGQL